MRVLMLHIYFFSVRGFLWSHEVKHILLNNTVRVWRLLLFYEGKRSAISEQMWTRFRKLHANRIITSKLQIYVRLTRISDGRMRCNKAVGHQRIFKPPSWWCTSFELCFSLFLPSNAPRQPTHGQFTYIYVIWGKHTFKLILNWMVACPC